MPWKETRVHELREQFVALYLTGRYTKTELCQLFDISRPTGDKWLARYDSDNPAWMIDQTCAPDQHPNATPPDRVAAILALRAEHPRWGPRKLRAILQRQQPTIPWPAPSTTGHLLFVAGCSTPRPRRPHAWPSATLTPPTARRRGVDGRSERLVSAG